MAEAQLGCVSPWAGEGIGCAPQPQLLLGLIAPPALLEMAMRMQSGQDLQ